MSEEPTTPESVELYRQRNDAYNRRDWDYLASLLSPDVVYRPISSFTDTRERRGREDVRRFFLKSSWKRGQTTSLRTSTPSASTATL